MVNRWRFGCLALTLVDVWPHQGLDEGAESGGRHSHAKCTFSLLFPRGD